MLKKSILTLSLAAMLGLGALFTASTPASAGRVNVYIGVGVPALPVVPYVVLHSSGSCHWHKRKVRVRVWSRRKGRYVWVRRWRRVWVCH